MNIVGKKIVEVRAMTEEEKDELGWYRFTPVIVLDDGTIMYASSDEEGNAAGAMFLDRIDGSSTTLQVQEAKNKK